MEATHTQTPPGLVFAAQVPFSWTRRWALARRSRSTGMEQRTYRIAGSAQTLEELTAVIAFAREYEARLELD